MTVLRGGFFDFGCCLEQVGDLVAAFTARLCVLRGGDGGGISAVVVRVLPAKGGAAVLVGSLRFLDVVPCSAGTVANAVELPPPKSRAGGNEGGDGECEACGEDAFPYLAAILCFSP